MNLKLINYIFVTLALLIGYCSSVLPQNKCNLQISIYEFKEDGSSEQFPIRDAKILLVSTKNKKSLKISKNKDMPTLADFVEGEFELTVSKDGFKKLKRIFWINCGLADAQNTYSIIEFLWKGNFKETVKFGKYGSDNIGGYGYYEIKGEQPVNNGAVFLGKPEYPKTAQAVRASGAVNVQVTINELGYVISAKAISGHPLLQTVSVEAAKKSKFRMTFFRRLSC